MSEVLDAALSLAQQGVRLFPVRFNEKIPAIMDFTRKATANPDLLKEFFASGKFNGGIACGKVAEGLYLVGFDIDCKPGRNGYETLAELEKQGFLLPATWSQKTPSGGEHRLFWSRVPIRQGADTVGLGIDLRGDGGYLVSPGSLLPGGVYSVLRDLPIAPFPDWAVERFEKKATVLSMKRTVKPVENQVMALARAVEFLQKQPAAYSGVRSHEGYRVAAKLKDFGVDETQVADLLLQYWDCEPMLETHELDMVIHNAFRYGQNPVGIAAPENMFEVVEGGEGNNDGGGTEPPRYEYSDELAKMNEDHFFCASELVSRVCWETVEDGIFRLERFPLQSFHDKYLSRTIVVGSKDLSLTREWLKWPKRRTYDGFRFDPSYTIAPNYYNLWRGFAVKPDSTPRTSEAAESVNLFFQHIKQNICNNNEEHYQWVVSFMAHIFQRPGEKPEVAMVLKGLKGTGKTILSEVLGFLIGQHAAILTDKTLVVGHFNSVMEDKLLITLDEAFWSGDKSIEGTLKHIITGGSRMITRKGCEAYNSKVFDRVIIVGNEDWLVPATADERRFAVFNVGNGNRRDRKFFGKISDGIKKHGGAALLMQRLLEWDLTKIDINVAPETEALYEQKEQSLNYIQSWWKECLEEGKILGSAMDGIPLEATGRSLYDAFTAHYAQLKIKYPPTYIAFSRSLARVLPETARKRTSTKRFYALGTLAELRATWDAHFNYAHPWEALSIDDLI